MYRTSHQKCRWPQAVSLFCELLVQPPCTVGADPWRICFRALGSRNKDFRRVLVERLLEDAPVAIAAREEYDRLTVGRPGCRQLIGLGERDSARRCDTSATSS